MTSPDVPLEGDPGDALRGLVRELSLMLDSDRVNLADLGRVYARITRTVLQAIEQAGISSLRFRAAARALDLKTPKSRLEAFLGDARTEGEPN